MNTHDFSSIFYQWLVKMQPKVSEEVKQKANKKFFNNQPIEKLCELTEEADIIQEPVKIEKIAMQVNKNEFGLVVVEKKDGNGSSVLGTIDGRDLNAIFHKKCPNPCAVNVLHAGDVVNLFTKFLWVEPHDSIPTAIEKMNELERDVIVVKGNGNGYKTRLLVRRRVIADVGKKRNAEQLQLIGTLQKLITQRQEEDDIISRVIDFTNSLEEETISRSIDGEKIYKIKDMIKHMQQRNDKGKALIETWKSALTVFPDAYSKTKGEG